MHRLSSSSRTVSGKRRGRSDRAALATVMGAEWVMGEDILDMAMASA